MLLDVLIRYPTAGMLLVIAILSVRDTRNSAVSVYASLVCITAAALLLGTSYEELRLPLPVHSFVRIIDAPSVAFIWWFGLALFDDDFRLGLLAWLGFLLVTIPTLVYRFAELGFIVQIPEPYFYLVTVVSFLMMGHLSYHVWTGRKDDVIESRRTGRVYYIHGLILTTVVIMLGDRLVFSEYPQLTHTARAGVIMLMTWWSAFWLLKFQSEKILFETVTEVTKITPAIDPRDEGLHKLLIAEMEENRGFVEPGLTIRDLAEKLNAPEHHLRQLINRGLGFRNFSQFLNSYRIEAVKQAMRQPENSRIPILSLALGVGFNSLAPFNRAFLAATGQTPSQFREELSKKPDQN